MGGLVGWLVKIFVEWLKPVRMFHVGHGDQTDTCHLASDRVLGWLAPLVLKGSDERVERAGGQTEQLEIRE